MNKYRWQAIVFVLVAFMLGCNEFIVVGVLSDIAKEFQVPVATVGYLVTIFATVYAVSTPFVTILTSRYSRYKTLMVLMGIFLLGNTLSGFAMNYPVLLISRMVTAMVAGAIISLIMTFASTIAPREKRAGLVSWIFAGFSIARSLGCRLGRPSVPVIAGTMPFTWSQGSVRSPGSCWAGYCHGRWNRCKVVFATNWCC